MIKMISICSNPLRLNLLLENRDLQAHKKLGSLTDIKRRKKKRWISLEYLMTKRKKEVMTYCTLMNSMMNK